MISQVFRSKRIFVAGNLIIFEKFKFLNYLDDQIETLLDFQGSVPMDLNLSKSRLMSSFNFFILS